VFRETQKTQGIYKKADKKPGRNPDFSIPFRNPTWQQWLGKGN
jgi:hypothetical protein